MVSGTQGEGQTDYDANEPAFGAADLSNCEHEQIHLAGSIQPHGALLVLREGDGRIVQASANAAEFLGLPSSPLGQPLDRLAENISERIAPFVGRAATSQVTTVQCRLGEPRRRYYCHIHHPHPGDLVIELEEARDIPERLSESLQSSLHTITATSSMQSLCDESARMLKEVIGYDRVMVYRFDDDGHGEVFSEAKTPELDPLLGIHYPSSDIPHIARRLYQHNRVRMLVDVAYQPVPLTPLVSPTTGAELDMSMCVLRSMSPIHIQYLKNMGVVATLVISLVVGGELWGLIACHHYSARHIDHALRLFCDLLAETISTRIAALESFARSESELAVRRIEQRIVDAVARDGQWQRALFENANALLKPMAASGAALLFESEITTIGEVPGTQELRKLGEWLEDRPMEAVYATRSLTRDAPELEGMAPTACGVLAIAVSSTPADRLIFFRPEFVETVTWGGNPMKPFEIGNDPSDLSPRRSFAKWYEQVEGMSEKWTAHQLAAARLLGVTISDVVLQFRAVRMLIARDQLAQVVRQVESSDQPVLLLEKGGDVLIVNPALERLLGRGAGELKNIGDLSSSFVDSAQVAANLRNLVDNGQSWTGEASLASDAGARPTFIRADPVSSSPHKVLGHVILFSDLSEKREAELARKNFYEEIVGQSYLASAQTGRWPDQNIRRLHASIIGNAQLAAYEITDSVDLADIPDMLTSVTAAASRIGTLLEHLIWHIQNDGDEIDDAKNPFEN